MVCTFGDATDVEWWRNHELPLRQVIDPTGRLAPVSFGSPGWESIDPAGANRAYGRSPGSTSARRAPAWWGCYARRCARG